jgi:hypothetical protein
MGAGAIQPGWLASPPQGGKRPSSVWAPQALPAGCWIARNVFASGAFKVCGMRVPMPRYYYRSGKGKGGSESCTRIRIELCRKRPGLASTPSSSGRVRDRPSFVPDNRLGIAILRRVLWRPLQGEEDLWRENWKARLPP